MKLSKPPALYTIDNSTVSFPLSRFNITMIIIRILSYRKECIFYVNKKKY